MKKYVLTTIERHTAANFQIGQMIEPSMYPHLFCTNHNFNRTRGTAWTVVETNPYMGTVTVEKIEPQGLEAWLPATQLDNGGVGKVKKYKYDQGLWSTPFLDQLKKETDAAIQKHMDDAAKLTTYVTMGGNTMKVSADPTLPKDTCYLVGGPKHNTIATNDFAKVAYEMWEPSEKASSAIRGRMPTEREMSQELCKELRWLQPGVEIGGTGKHDVVLVDERAFLPNKNYARIEVSNEAVIAGDIVGEVRGGCYEACRLLASLIKKQIDTLVLSWHFEHRGVAVRFSHAVKIVRSYDDHLRFAAYDHVSDAVCFHLLTRYFVTPVGESE